MILPPTLYKGVRNNSLCAYAGSLRVRGFGTPQILEALREANQQRCTPPLPDSELRAIAKSSSKWPAYANLKQGEPHQAVDCPPGCFDPRPHVCGFLAATLVANDRTLKLRRRHRDLYGLLVELFGQHGCHPKQESIAKCLGTWRRQVARDIARLVNAGLLMVEFGDYAREDKKYRVNSYHFVRHELFRENLTASGLPIFNCLGETVGQITDEIKAVSPWVESAAQRFTQNQQVRANRDTRVPVVPITHRPSPRAAAGGAAMVMSDAHCAIGSTLRAPLPEKTLERCAPECSARGKENLALAVEKHAFTIRQSIACAHCGGMRILYGDGRVNGEYCSCELPVPHRAAQKWLKPELEMVQEIGEARFGSDTRHGGAGPYFARRCEHAAQGGQGAFGPVGRVSQWLSFGEALAVIEGAKDGELPSHLYDALRRFGERSRKLEIGRQVAPRSGTIASLSDCRPLPK